MLITQSDEIKKQAEELQKIARKMRREEFQRLRDKGWTLEKIAKEKGISKERVRQILEAGE